jgi:hypothetical protein
VLSDRYCHNRQGTIATNYRPVDQCPSPIVDKCLCGNHAQAHAAGDATNICDAVFNLRRRISYRGFLMQCSCAQTGGSIADGVP